MPIVRFRMLALRLHACFRKGVNPLVPLGENNRLRSRRSFDMNLDFLKLHIVDVTFRAP